ncbi:MAG TPA: tetratricopeptide repeat protein [Chryseolinea sp.]|nr:tetratricopeptide repeat protein [Chryseolinea sp.]
MPSILSGYAYDIFISYRHKDDRGEHWVTEFVRSLKTELEKTFKEEITIYFDANPGDGLLETHNVEKSLDDKLNSLVFIPILSQTYCDTKSYAWASEFCAFNHRAINDPFGRDIKVRNGNTASRILPIIINDLDQEDTDLIERQLQTRVRSVDFIFRSQGVNRPLRREDKRLENTSRLSYRDQINKVANAIKELIDGMKSPDRINQGSATSSVSAGNGMGERSANMRSQNDHSLGERSIAILPFKSLSHDVSQEYFADGIAENILIQLAGLRNLRVISRSSVMRYRKTTKSAPEIAQELGVKFLLEGSAQSSGNKVRINVHLVDAWQDHHVWAKTFTENLDDIFAIQAQVAEAVARELQASFQPEDNQKLNEKPTSNLEAYDLFLKGRHAFNQWGVDGYRTATEYFERALKKDPDFKLAYSYLASCYSARMSWNGDLSPAASLQHINTYLEEAFKRGATDNDYLTKVFVAFFVEKDFAAAGRFLDKAIELGPNNAAVYYTGSYLMCMTGKFDAALKLIRKAQALEPNSVSYFNYYGIYLYLTKAYDEAILNFLEAIKLYPQVIRFYDHLGRVYITVRNFEAGLDTLSLGLQFGKVRPPSMVAYMAVALLHLGNIAQAEILLNELILRSQKNEKGVNIYVAHIYAAWNDPTKAEAWLSNAELSNDVDLIWRNVDPLLAKAKEGSAPDFGGAEQAILNRLTTGLPQDLQYHNLEHIQDVLQAAVTIALEEGIGQEEVRSLRIAALFHDAGFITSPTEHEATGCQMARDLLSSFGFDDQHLQIICGMIMATKIPQSPLTHLEKILCDADLDYLGRDDFGSIGARLFEELKGQGIIESEREWNLIQKTFLETHRYHTANSRRLREGKKQENLQKIISKLKR